MALIWANERSRTSIDKAAGRVARKLLALERERDVTGSGVARGQVQLDGVGRDELGPDEHGAEDDLQALEEVLADDDHGGAAARRALVRTDGLDARRRDGRSS